MAEISRVLTLADLIRAVGDRDPETVTVWYVDAGYHVTHAITIAEVTPRGWLTLREMPPL